MAKDAYYFKHDFGARNDPKLQKVLQKLGHEGKSVFWDLIEITHEEGGYLLLSDIDNYAFSLRTKVELINSLIHDFGLFQWSETKFWSVSALNRIDDRYSKNIVARSNAGKKWGNEPEGLSRSERLTKARQLATHTKSEWAEMIVFFKSTCVRCGTVCEVVKDHIVPIYQGGSDGISNLQPLCSKCNASKGSESIDHRVKYCLQNKKEMPAKFLEMPALKEKRRKEIKVKEIYKGLGFFTKSFLSLWNDYLEMRVKIRKPATEKAEELALSKLKDLSGGDRDIARKIVEQSIANSWQGLFPLKSNDASTKSFPTGHPDYFSKKHEDSLQQKDREIYWRHLRELGFTPKKDNQQTVVDWIKIAS